MLMFVSIFESSGSWFFLGCGTI